MIRALQRDPANLVAYHSPRVAERDAPWLGFHGGARHAHPPSIVLSENEARFAASRGLPASALWCWTRCTGSGEASPRTSAFSFKRACDWSPSRPSVVEEVGVQGGSCDFTRSPSAPLRPPHCGLLSPSLSPLPFAPSLLFGTGMAQSSLDRQLAEALAWGAEHETEEATWEDATWDECAVVPEPPRGEPGSSHLNAVNEDSPGSWEEAAWGIDEALHDGLPQRASWRSEEADGGLNHSFGGHLPSKIEQLDINEDGTHQGGAPAGLSAPAAEVEEAPGGSSGNSSVGAQEFAARASVAGLSPEAQNASQAALESITPTTSGREESWVCAICHGVIPLADTAQIKGCEHAYCAQCILHWASYKQYPWCPQCRLPFESLLLFKMLDGSLSDAMVEESVCLLLRATWYVPLEVPIEADPEDDPFVDDEYDEEEYYRSSLRIGNRRWGENGYVRGGRMQARVTVHQSHAAGSSATRQGDEAAKASSGAAEQGMGRRAKRAQKRELADKGATGSSPAAESTSAAASSASASGTSATASGASTGTGRRAQRREKQRQNERRSGHQAVPV